MRRAPAGILTLQLQQDAPECMAMVLHCRTNIENQLLDDARHGVLHAFAATNAGFKPPGHVLLIGRHERVAEHSNSDVW